MEWKKMKTKKTGKIIRTILPDQDRARREQIVEKAEKAREDKERWQKYYDGEKK